MSDGLASLLALAAAAPAEVPVLARSRVEPVDGRWAWVNDAVCVGVDQEVFYPVHISTGSSSKPLPPEVMEVARGFCQTCPAYEACLDHAVHHEPVGIWAGTDPHTRTRMRRSLGLGQYQTAPDPAAPPVSEEPLP